MGLATQNLTDAPLARPLYGIGKADKWHTSSEILQHTDRMMNAREVVDSLVQHGLKEITASLDLEKCDQLPTAIGGFGDIYQGVTFTGRVISLKCLQPTFILNKEGRKQLKRAARELYTWSKCNHPGVLPLFGLALYRGQLAMVSPWMENGNLRSYLSARRPSSTNRLTLTIEIAGALNYLHNAGVVHGDLKAANISISGDDTPRLADFGCAKLQEYSLLFSSTRVGADVSIRWSAPEIILGDGTPTYETDVYALGMSDFFAQIAFFVLKETFTNSDPYAGVHEAAVWMKIMKQVLPQRPEKDMPTGDNQADHLWMLLNQCWASDPLNRPTAGGVRDKLQEIVSMYPLEREMEDPITGVGGGQERAWDPGYQTPTIR
ncbi:unnamed protein product [Rhizoctonia solani]|uniref:Protein kinase domain-containing protein n=1 Tax=Rhizoctonia solani TaxID=456999 RepID=A0A8H2XLJ2_9AGAM|nr:unnamed protein product [Rhizoctonia solani]